MQVCISSPAYLVRAAAGGGGPVAYRAASKVASDPGADTVSPTVNAPAGVQNGDLIFIAFGGSGNGSTSMAVSNGFTEIHFGQTNGSDGIAGVMYKIASGGETSWTFTDLFGTAEWCIFVALAYTGVDQGSPISGTATEVYPAATTTPVCTAMTPAHNNCMVISCFGCDANSNLYAGTAGSGWTERADNIDAVGTNGHIFVQELLQTTAVSVAGDFIADVSDAYGCIQFALKPS
jgi:hypothetical protein